MNARNSTRLVIVLLCSLFVTGCNPDSTSSAADVEVVETLTEEVANRIIEFSYDLKKRDYAKAATCLASNFQGRGYRSDGEWQETSEELPLGVLRRTREVGTKGPLLSAAEFLTDLENLLSPFESVDRVFFKTRGAEFGKDRKQGTLRLTTEIIGRGTGGNMRAIYGYASGVVARAASGWQLTRFDLEKYHVTTRGKPIYTDVAEAAGVAQTGPRLGRDGNDKFYWRGAACADVDGDGLYDVFSSTHKQNFLYINLGNGRFEDRAKAAGLSSPVGPTSPLFFDFDNDGDKDLFMSFVGWEDDGVPGGETLHLFENDGKGGFSDVTAKLGLSEMRACAFTTVAADIDNDGWLDVYICAYNRLDVVYPDSWYDAKNGSPNLLLKNQGGKRFVEDAAARGLAGNSWSYASAAADFDEDGDQDFYVANDYGKNSFYINQGDGRFVDAAEKLGVLDTGNGMGTAWGDLNNDGRLDLYVSNMSSSAGNRILRRLAGKEGQGVMQTLFKLAAGNTIFHSAGDRFEMLPAEAGGISASWAWGVSLFDADLDGLLDVYVANGFISGDSLKDT
ncbi:MAG: VCBS repeat-containing protein [Planctomycetota bacterium]|nr:VCBS repeat-containing protein [Planctomycetota bacterium]